MENERWRQISHLYGAALLKPELERAAFVRDACGGDDALRSEVESLLAQANAASGFLNGPAVDTAARLITDEHGTLIGRQIGVYRVLSLLGAGGMGEVYRARDTKLGRDVAIKVLPAMFTADRDRLARFEREARMLATLNHPHIGTIYGVEESDGVRALVLELVEGPTLAGRLAKGPIPLAEALPIARQIADALDAAHERGIVHRDLKPANIKITPDGIVKVLDFGLAKAATGDGARRDLSQSPTVTFGGTSEGVILGTAAYMSPEQAAGKPADKRSDLWAFGVVLFEMLTARPVFGGETMSDVLAAVLTAEPNWTTLPAQIPPPIRRLLRRCLEKDRKRRFESAADARFEIEEALAPPPAEASVVVHHRPGWQKWSIATAVLMIVIASLAAGFASRRQPVASPMRFAIPVSGEVSQLAISSDGRSLAFVMLDQPTGKNVISVQAIGERHATPLAGTEDASYPFWSPDAAYIGFFADGKLMKLRLSGGAPQTIIAATRGARGASWGSKDVIVYSQRPAGPLWRVNADGSGGSVLTDSLMTADERSHRWPMFLPDGDRFLFWAGNFAKDGAKSGIYLSSLSKRQKTFLVEARSNPGFAQNGNLFYVGEKGQLEMQPFDPDAGHVTGERRLIAGTVGFQPSTYWGAFTVSASGTVVTNPGSAVFQSVLTWYDRRGTELGVVGRSAVVYNPSLSPDGRQLAADIADPVAANLDIWTFDLRAGTSGRFTFGTLEESTPVWAPDGRRIAYVSGDTGTEVKLTTGLEKESIVAERPTATLTIGGNSTPLSWSPDGEYLLTRNAGIGQETHYLTLFKVGEQKPLRLLASKGNQSNGQVSPDGKWLAYATDESGVWNIYVTTFPGAAGKWQVSTGGGTEPRWRGDAKEMFYLAADNMLTAVSVETGSTFSSGTPQPLFRAHSRPPISNTDVFSYDVTKDGTRFIVNRYLEPSPLPPLDILLNATAQPDPALKK